MARRKLATATKAKNTQDALLNLEQNSQPKQQASPMRRSTEQLTISLLEEEKRALEARAFSFRDGGHRELKTTSRLARVAFQMLLNASDEEILEAAKATENLEKRRGKRY